VEAAVRIRRRVSDPRRGQALLLVMIISTFIMGSWAISFRMTREAIDAEAFSNDRAHFEGRIVKATAWAGHLLEDEQLQAGRYRFIYAGEDARGRFRTLVEIRRRGGERYQIRAQAADGNTGRGLPVNPDSLR
jgi:hypothetical protein